MAFISNNIESEGYITGNTITANTITANSVSATTISGITFHGNGSNLTDIIFTGGTVTGNTIFTGNVNVSGITTLNNLTYINGTYASGKVLTSDSNGNATWQFPVTYASQTYMFSSANSDIGGYEQAVILPLYSTATTASQTALATVTPTLIASFATNLNYPNVPIIPSGNIIIHYESEKAAGSNNYYTYVEVYKRNSGGTETLITTSDSSTQTSSNTIQQVTVGAFLTNNVSLLTTDRIVVKIYGVMLSSSANITIYYDDNTDSRFELPIILDDAQHVPYIGAINDVDLGTHKIFTSGLTSYDGITGTTLNISTVPSNDNALTNVLVRAADGTIKYRTVASIVGTGGTGASITAFTYDNLNTLTLTDSISTTFSATINQMSGLTINGNLTTNTISATTYLNLPSSTFTGGTVTGATNFTNGLTANTISATSISGITYYGDGSNLTGVAHAFTGTTTIDFDCAISGETSMTYTAITNSNINSNSTVLYRVLPSTNHPNVEESLVEGLMFTTTSVVDGVGFDLQCVADGGTWGIYNIMYRIIN